MSGFLVHDRIWCDTRFIGLSDGALTLWLRAGAWCAGHIADGLVPTEVIPHFGRRGAVSELVRRGLWEQLEDGYRIVDWHHDPGPVKPHLHVIQGGAA